jgi:hypothetical protein
MSIALIVGSVGSWLLDGRRIRAHASARLSKRTGLPVLIEVLPTTLNHPRMRRRRASSPAMTSSLAVATSALLTHTPAIGAAATLGRNGPRAVADHLDEALRHRRLGSTRSHGGVLIVTSDDERMSEVLRTHRWLQNTGQNPVGIVLVAR